MKNKGLIIGGLIIGGLVVLFVTTRKKVAASIPTNSSVIVPKGQTANVTGGSANDTTITDSTGATTVVSPATTVQATEGSTVSTGSGTAEIMTPPIIVAAPVSTPSVPQYNTSAPGQVTVAPSGTPSPKYAVGQTVKIDWNGQDTLFDIQSITYNKQPDGSVTYQYDGYSTLTGISGFDGQYFESMAIA
jgi:hypothetical protein